MRDLARYGGRNPLNIVSAARARALLASPGWVLHGDGRGISLSARRAGRGAVIEAGLRPPKSGGMWRYFRRRLRPGWTDAHFLSAARRAYTEAWAIARLNARRDHLHASFERTSDAVREAAEAHGRATGRTTIYLEMADADIDAWHAWLSARV